MKLLSVFVATATAVLSTSSLVAAESWGPFPVKVQREGVETASEFQPLESATQPWKICVLVPHVKDSYWLAADYGLIEEARRLGVDLTLYEAGGYGNLPRQVNQFDNCLSSKVDAILVAPISEAGLSGSFEKARATGIPTIAFINPVSEAPVAGKVFTRMRTKGVEAGNFLVEVAAANGSEYKVVGFPGAQGSGWAEAAVEGFQAGIQGSDITLLDVKFGDTGVAEQLSLVEDALQTYPEMNLIWGTAPTVEAAIGVVDEIGRDDVSIMAEYGTREMLRLLQQEQIMGLVSDYTVVQARMAVDLAVMAIEGNMPEANAFDVEPALITDPDVSTDDILLHFAPANWRPVFSSK